MISIDENDVLAAILSGQVASNDEYSVWFQGNSFPVKELFRKAHELSGKSIVNPNFTTDQAQSKLWSLGFPIVDPTCDEWHISYKELESFSILIKRNGYDSSNRIDKNIGDFLNQIIWQKAKKWREGLKKLGWDVKGRMSWNEQANNTVGQRFRKFVWYRVLPRTRVSDLLFYTIGFEESGEIVYKIDVKWDNEFFTSRNGRGKAFNEYRKQNGLLWQRRRLSKGEHVEINELIELSNSYFTGCEVEYAKLSSLLFPNERLMRLTWNTNSWTKPTRHEYDIANINNSSSRFDEKYGYANEEWLFSHEFTVGKVQFGFIEGASKLGDNGPSLLERVHLFTINDKSKSKYYVGYIDNLEVLNQDEINNLPLGKWNEIVKRDIQEIEGSLEYVKERQWLPNVKFNIEDVQLLDELLVMKGSSNSKQNRFVPYKVSKLGDEIYNLYKSSEQVQVQWKSGRGNPPDEYEMNTKAKKRKVTRIHTDLVNGLADYLELTYPKDQISAELFRIDNKLIDIAVRNSNTFILFEIKTSKIAKDNIRQALGQLLEYAYYSDLEIESLIIAGPAAMSKNDLDYLRRLKHKTQIPLEYWHIKVAQGQKDSVLMKYV
ncbi:hypothetical protein [Phaeocystidibacter marisrubri]|uniref:Uncharacterized protein n=1 Tax=Phaeocystidibacter marisrubri TaxID=1577780 RepID=A0A6L3ZD92_9FLAO|nr:hypothetical protein [Phaeocystidibacter marisrubri]KAB2815821.1 hypothetical protein F8C82_08980 [Phaeocystidibacter marisrubri]GGH65879.1 hypothetical protein GCM10011318_03310 [Phaeocystidibacter marisrubri]